MRYWANITTPAGPEKRYESGVGLILSFFGLYPLSGAVTSSKAGYATASDNAYVESL
jgi:hypothetical protein